ncbi:MAG: 30S ribosomal protein S21 [Calditrichia bacterium]|nr:30S ribosomal protein S21 [Calditrichia bacterium]
MVYLLINKKISFDANLKMFDQKCRKAKIFQIMREKTFYLNPSEKKHRRKPK